MREVSYRGMIDLRGDARDAAFRAAVESALGVPLPIEPRTSSPSPSMGEGRGGGNAAPQAPATILWLSIDQWLILCPRPDTPRLLADLRARLGAIHSLAVDVSDARAIVRLEGEAVRPVLMKSIPVDLTLPGHGVGAVRRVRFGEVAALIHVAAEAPDAIDLYVFRSYAEFAWDLLLATATAGSALTLFGEQPPPPV
jgi:sarcosine oxidase subunit gamma